MESTASTEDFRVRSAAEKRERMHARLIAATMEAYLQAPAGFHPVIDDVIRVADVSRGTFYKYFDSLDEVRAKIGRSMAGEMLSSYEALFAGIEDYAVRMAAGPLMALARAAMESRHAAFISRVDFIEFLDGEDPRSVIVKRGLEEGRQRGQVQFESLEAAVDLVVGVSLEGARRILQTGALDGAYIRETATLVMLGLGLSRPEAKAAVTAAWEHLQKVSGRLHWWRPVGGI